MVQPRRISKKAEELAFLPKIARRIVNSSAEESGFFGKIARRIVNSSGKKFCLPEDPEELGCLKKISIIYLVFCPVFFTLVFCLKKITIIYTCILTSFFYTGILPKKNFYNLPGSSLVVQNRLDPPPSFCTTVVHDFQVNF